MFDEAKYDEVVAHVKALASAAGAIDVRHHFAGYFNELGLWVRFERDTTDRSITSVSNQLRSYLNEVLPLENADFAWILSLERGADTVEVIVAGVIPRDVDYPPSVLK